MSGDKNVKKDKGLAVKDQPSMLVISDEVVDTYMSTSQMLTDKFREWLIPEVDFTTKIFGKSRKPTLLDPGAGKLIGFFQCRPRHRILERFYDKDHEGYESIRYAVATEIVQTSTGNVVAEGVGSCSSDEVKYKYRWFFGSELEKMGVKQEERHKLPTRITGGGATQYRFRNPEIPDLDNTIFKMAAKRSEVDGCLQLPGVAAVFTQDVGDYKTPAVKPSEKPEVTKDIPSDQRDIYPSPEKLNTPTWDFADAIAMQGWDSVDGIIKKYLSDMGYQNPTEAFEFSHDVAKAWVRNAPGVYLGDTFKEVDTVLKIAGFMYNRNEKRWRFAKPEKPSAERPSEEPAEEPEPTPKGGKGNDSAKKEHAPESRLPVKPPGSEEAPAPEPSEEKPPVVEDEEPVEDEKEWFEPAEPEKEPLQGHPRSVEDVTERIAALLPMYSELVVVSDRGDYYRVGRVKRLDKEIEDHIDVIVSEMGGEWDNENNEWRIPKEAEG